MRRENMRITKEKRVVALLLAIVLCILSFVQYTFAEDFNESISQENVATRTTGTQVNSETDNEISNNVDIYSNSIPVAVDEGTQETQTNKRYSVLVLDTSSTSSFEDKDGNVFYVADTALDYVKTAAKKFIKDVQKANGTNYVAIVEYKYNYANIVQNFSTDQEQLVQSIDSLTANSTRKSISYGLRSAENLIESINEENVSKNIVLFTTGMTNEGDYTYEGHYNEDTVGSEWYRTDNKVKLYAYANTAYDDAERIKEKAKIYTVGLFQTMEDIPAEGRDVAQFFYLLTHDLATSDAYFYDVDDPNKLDFVFGEIADKVTIQGVKFNYASGSAKDYEDICYYSDTYFDNPSLGEKRYDQYNTNLSTASLCMALSAFGSNIGGKQDYTYKYRNVKKLMGDLGFDKETFYHNDWFEQKPQTDSIGVAISQKKINSNNKDYTLIAVAVRGGGYESEWAGNFTVGRDGQHYGFSIAKDQVIDSLKQYLHDNNISGDIKLWITGYSRAAATSNLVAGTIDDMIDEGTKLKDDVLLEKQNLFAYCFETPMGALNEDVVNEKNYYNIYNIINRNDPVPMVAMKTLGFRRYGSDFYLPDKATDGRDYLAKLRSMLYYYNNSDSKEEIGNYNVDDFKKKKILNLSFLYSGMFLIVDDVFDNSSQGVFLDSTITKLTKEMIGTRDSYVTNLQNGIRIIFSSLYGEIAPNDTETRLNLALDLFIDKLLSPEYLKEIMLYALNPASDTNVHQLIENLMIDSLNESGINYYSVDGVHDFVFEVIKLIGGFSILHPNSTVTLIGNLKRIGSAHYPELCLSWLKSQDRNYTANPIVSDGNGIYRIIHINCPIDVEIYDEDGNICGKIIDNTPQEFENGSVITSFTDEGEKIVCLPANASYSLKMTATDSGAMDISLNEFSSSFGDITRLINYLNINIEKHNYYLLNIPSLSKDELTNESKGSITQYDLKDQNDNEITPDKDVVGDEAANSYYYVEVKAEQEQYGTAFGSGIQYDGSYVQLSAAAQNGYIFDGWFEDNICISTDINYRFRPTKDTTIIAKFKESSDDSKNESSNKEDLNNNQSSNNSSIKSNMNKSNTNDKKSTIAANTGDFCNTHKYIIMLVLTSILFISLFLKKNSKKQ